MDYPIYTRRQTAATTAVDADTLGINADNVQDALQYLIDNQQPPVVVGGNGPVRVEVRTLTALEALNKSLLLTVAPADVTHVAMDVMGGCAQLLGFDFTVSGATVDWSTSDLADLLTVGDTVRFIYTAVPEYRIIYVMLTSAMIAAKEVVLPTRASYPTQLVLDVIGGCPQFYGFDYTCDGLKITWSGLGLESLLESGDHIRIAYLT